MTDEELIKHLRAGPEIVYRYVSVDHAAADRIEQLQSKLAKAVDVLRRVVPYWNEMNPLRLGDFHNDSCNCYRCDFDKASVVLAELEKTK